MTLEDARRIIAAAEKKAASIGQPMNIAVADEGGNLVAHVRMDGAWIGSIDISINKAFTARAFDIATKDLAAESQPGKQFFGIHASNHGRVMIFAGGIPLEARRQGRRSHRRERWLGRSGSRGRGGGRRGVLRRFDNSRSSTEPGVVLRIYLKLYQALLTSIAAHKTPAEVTAVAAGRMDA